MAKSKKINGNDKLKKAMQEIRQSERNSQYWNSKSSSPETESEKKEETDN